MGGSASRAKEEKVKKINQLMAILTGKRDEFLATIQASRGMGNENSYEVAGGRTVMRQSECRVKTGMGVDDALEDALCDFIDCAQGGAQVKAKAIEGGKKLLRAGLDALFGASEGQGMEKRGFVIMFMNYAFVRIDYHVYTYCASGKKWGMHDSESGSCYVADLAVLDPAELMSSEVDFLLAQSLCAPSNRAIADTADITRGVFKPSYDPTKTAEENKKHNEEVMSLAVRKANKEKAGKASSDIELINRMKVLLMFGCLLSRQMKEGVNSFEELEKITDKLETSLRGVKDIFDNLDPFEPRVKQVE